MSSSVETPKEKNLHRQLVEIAYKWVLKNTSCGVAFKELNTYASNREYPDVIGFGAWAHSVLIEVKVSRSDFLNDKKKKFRKNPEKGMGRQRFYCCPTGLIKMDELPKGWGLIYVSDKMKAKCVHSPYAGNIGERHDGFLQNIEAEHGFMYSALRRLHLRGRIDEVYMSKDDEVYRRTDEEWKEYNEKRFIFEYRARVANELAKIYYRRNEKDRNVEELVIDNRKDVDGCYVLQLPHKDAAYQLFLILCKKPANFDEYKRFVGDELSSHYEIKKWKSLVERHGDKLLDDYNRGVHYMKMAEWVKGNVKLMETNIDECQL